MSINECKLSVCHKEQKSLGFCTRHYLDYFYERRLRLGMSHEEAIRIMKSFYHDFNIEDFLQNHKGVMLEDLKKERKTDDEIQYEIQVLTTGKSGLKNKKSR